MCWRCCWPRLLPLCMPAFSSALPTCYRCISQGLRTRLSATATSCSESLGGASVRSRRSAGSSPLVVRPLFSSWSFRTSGEIQYETADGIRCRTTCDASCFCFRYLTQRPYFGHQPGHEQTQDASKHHLADSFQANLNSAELRMMCQYRRR